MNFAIRRASFPGDYSGIARLLTAEQWPTTPEELMYEDTVRDPKLHKAVFVAEDVSQEEKRLIGIASVGHDALAHRDGKFRMDIRVYTDLQGRDVGAQLYQAILEHLGPFEAHELQTEVWAAHERGVRFVTDRGFVEVWRRIDSRLDVSHFDATAYAGLEERVRAPGLEVKTYAELEHDSNRVRKLYELDRELWRDVPFGEAITNRSLERFELEEILAPKFIPEACFIAIHGDVFVGYSNLTQAGAYYDTEMTGVLRPYRGKGVATLLKLRGIQYAQAHGCHEVWTVNDSVNAAMLALNNKLGFQYQGATIRFIKRANAHPYTVLIC